MGRKRLPEDQKKVGITLRITKAVVDQLKEIDNYNSLVEKLIVDFLKNRENSEKEG